MCSAVTRNRLPHQPNQQSNVAQHMPETNRQESWITAAGKRQATSSVGQKHQHSFVVCGSMLLKQNCGFFWKGAFMPQQLFDYSSAIHKSHGKTRRLDGTSSFSSMLHSITLKLTMEPHINAKFPPKFKVGLILKLFTRINQNFIQ